MSFNKKFAKLLPTVIILASFSALYFFKQNIYDFVALYGYTPPLEVSILADKSGMSAKSKNTFYVYKPVLLDKNDFNKNCPVGEETIVLGCYNGTRIYIFNVKDTQLEGVKEVTAAHEMLHAEYDRLSPSERSRVNKLIENQMKLITDERILKNIEAYRKKDPSIVMNETHSIIGTEVSNLSPELENYYGKYFTNRSKVVTLSKNYESVFSSIKSQVASYDVQLSQLKIQIESLENDLSIRANSLIEWSNKLEELKKLNKVEEYNSQVTSYNSKVYAYRKDLEYVKSLINQYNSLVELRNNLAVQQNNLYKSIDSNSKDL